MVYGMCIGRETSHNPRGKMHLYEITYLPTNRSRKVCVTGIFADSIIQARRFLRQDLKVRMGDIKIITCEIIAAA